MPIFKLEEEPIFPPAELADPQGIIAVGGDLSPERLLNAYASGIFPWFSAGDPIMWWSPDPRLILQPGDLHVSTSMKKLVKQKRYTITMDREFQAVIQACAAPRKSQPETWITPDMQTAYTTLHHLGFAHSVEVWSQDDQVAKKLVGGLYGISLGKCFFGESMFSRQPNVSKLAFITLAQTLFEAGFLIIDCQLPTNHLKVWGPKKYHDKIIYPCWKPEYTIPHFPGNGNSPLPVPWKHEVGTPMEFLWLNSKYLNSHCQYHCNYQSF